MFKVSVVDYARVLFYGQAKSVVLPGKEGVFEVLDFHAPIISLLAEGDIIIDGEIIPVLKGIMYFYNDELTALVER
ncbi:MAG: F0F1 ATP synthase subunit epsilon [Candidatus Omnitrophota bacterium]